MYFAISCLLLDRSTLHIKTGSNIFRNVDKCLPVGTSHYARRPDFHQDHNDGNKSNNALNYFEFVYFNVVDVLGPVLTRVKI
jgi:hypothetical protein